MPAKPAGDKSLESHFRMAPVYGGQLFWAALMCTVLAAACLVLGLVQTLPSAWALGLHLALVAGILAALWRMVWLRGAVSLDREERATQRRKEEERARAGRESLFAEEPEGIPRRWTAEYKLEGYAYVHQRIILIVVALGAGILSLLYLIRPVPAVAGSVLAVAALELVIGFTCLMASRYFGLVGRRGIREAPALAGWLRGVQWLSFAAAMSLFMAKNTEYTVGKVAYYRSVGVERWVCRVILAWTVLCALELLVRAFMGLLGQRRSFEEVEVPIELVSVQLVFAAANPLKSLSEGVERYLGISLQASWGLRFLGRAFLPLVLLLALLLWGMTALEVVHPHEQGILEHWGKYTGKPLEPGLHVKWPWPIDRIHHYPATQVSEVKLGFTMEGEEERQLKFVLWTRVHADEYKLILNEGNDLLSLVAYVYYRIKDAEQYAYGMQNPDEGLEALAYRELLRSILPYRLEELLLGKHRQEFPGVLHKRIQDAVDRQQLGIEIVKVAFMGLHPPVKVADAYHEVVSAQIWAETRLHAEVAYRNIKVPNARGEHVEIVNAARAEAVGRKEMALGRAAAFRALLEAYRSDPALFEMVQGIQAYEEALAGKPFVVKDDALDTSSFELIILNLRQGLPLMPFGLPRGR